MALLLLFTTKHVIPSSLAVVVWALWALSAQVSAFSTASSNRFNAAQQSGQEYHDPTITTTSTTSNVDNIMVSRRSAIGIGLASLISFTQATTLPANADETTTTTTTTTTALSETSTAPTLTLEDARTQLLNMIQQNSNNHYSEDEIFKAVEQLIPFDPTQGRAATMAQDLDGEWKLLWSIKADAFSPLLKLPKPFKPESYQYLGTPATLEVGVDRVAQGLTGGILGTNNQLWLSSGVVPSETDPSVLEIYPPFRFQFGGRYGSGKEKIMLVEAGSDADFRKVNGRTSEAQQAPKNLYKQLYLEQQGKGSLRISTITEGDPVIVGAVFVHQKM